MKNVWIALLLLLTVSGCLPDKIGKKDDPEPVPELAGTYQVSRLSDETGSYNLPTTINGRRVSATVVVSPGSNDNQISFRIDTYLDGQLTDRGQSIDVTIQKASGQNYDILLSSNRIGNINGTDFSIDATDAGEPIVIIARK